MNGYTVSSCSFIEGDWVICCMGPRDFNKSGVDVFMTEAEQILPANTENSVANVSSDNQAAARVLAVGDEPAACKLLSLALAFSGVTDHTHSF